MSVCVQEEIHVQIEHLVWGSTACLLRAHSPQLLSSSLGAPWKSGVYPPHLPLSACVFCLWSCHQWVTYNCGQIPLSLGTRVMDTVVLDSYPLFTRTSL